MRDWANEGAEIVLECLNVNKNTRNNPTATMFYIIWTCMQARIHTFAQETDMHSTHESHTLTTHLSPLAPMRS